MGVLGLIRTCLSSRARMGRMVCKHARAPGVLKPELILLMPAFPHKSADCLAPWGQVPWIRLSVAAQREVSQYTNVGTSRVSWLAHSCRGRIVPEHQPWQRLRVVDYGGGPWPSRFSLHPLANILDGVCLSGDAYFSKGQFSVVLRGWALGLKIPHFQPSSFLITICKLIKISVSVSSPVKCRC